MFACQAPADAEFVWLGGQWDSLTPHEAAHNYTNQGPAFIRGTTFCPHTYAITGRGAATLIDAARTIGIYKAVDIFLIEKLNDILGTYMVNDRRLATEGRIEPAPHQYVR